VPANLLAVSAVSVESDLYLQQESQITKLGPEKRESGITGGDSFLSESSPLVFEKMGEFQITAYSSTPDQTDSTPFTMASGKHVYRGAIAANFLPLGAKVRIPELYGDRVFTVEDRMNKRYTARMDIWMETRTEARSFGLKYVAIEVAK